MLELRLYRSHHAMALNTSYDRFIELNQRANTVDGNVD